VEQTVHAAVVAAHAGCMFTRARLLDVTVTARRARDQARTVDSIMPSLGDCC